MLTIVATPIGNLKDITLRTLEVLQSADAVICEDTRRTSLLLSHYQIKKSLIVLNDYNEARVVSSIIEKLKRNDNLALVSDAGTPLISDPGYKLVREALKQGIQIDSLPGPSSILEALTLSGLPPDKFLFLGYLPEKPGHRQNLLRKLVVIHQSLATTFIIFIAPHKLTTTLGEMKDIFGDIDLTLAKELTKVYQEVQTKKITDWLNEFELKSPKGEWVLLFRLEDSSLQSS